MNLITAVCCLFILYVTFSYSKLLWRLWKFLNSWAANSSLFDLTQTYPGLKSLNDNYERELCEFEGIGTKSKVRAENVYSRSNIAHAIGINLKAISSASGLISGLGVLGTFIGLTISVFMFNSNSSEAIMRSIQLLLGGMGTAFLTSVIGMGASSLYIKYQKKLYNRFDIAIDNWCKELDQKNYLSDIDLLRRENAANQQALVEKLQALQALSTEQHTAHMESIKEMAGQVKEQTQSITGQVKTLNETVSVQGTSLETLSKEVTESTENGKKLLEAMITFDDEGNAITPGDMLNNLYDESEKQSRSLESFTTDLSNELNASLGRTMDTSIVPLIQDLEKSHKLFNEKLDQLASNIQSPATDMVTTVVDELKSSMKQMTGEFKDTISHDTINQMESLSDSLSKTSTMLNEIPQTMQLMTSAIAENFNSIKDIIMGLQSAVESQQKDMLSNSKATNDAVISEMKIRFEELMTSVASTLSNLNEQHNELITQQDENAKGTIKLMSESVNDNVSNMKEAFGNLQATLVSQQKDLITSSKTANEAVVNEMKARFEQLMTSVAGTLSSLNEQHNNLISKQDDTAKDTIRLMSESVSTNVANMKEAFSGMQSSAASQQQAVMASLKKANEEMAASMKTKFESLSSAISATLTNLNEQQNNLINGQGRSTREIERLLTSFSESVNKMKQTNLETQQVLVKVQTIGSHLEESTERFNSLSALMKETSEGLMSQQKENMQQYKEVQAANQETVDNINEALDTTKQLIDEYTQQYEVIKQGLTGIFEEISKGLQDYSATLRTSTGDALSEYSSALEKSTKGLKNIAEALNESAEELSDGVDKLKGFRR